MAKTVYETLFILDSNRYARDPHGVSSQIAETIEKLDGEVLVSRLWNEQKLAYPIDGHHKGTYWLTYFRLEGPEITKLNRAFQLNENVLRHLALKVDPRLVETLVAHAQGRQVEVAEESDESGETAESAEAGETQEEAVAAGE
ncbi:MAG: 30S ribosomal protein S6 [Planctomycetales bacterium]|nr:30S ribosomal protein S6 [Planctomycetales bacterium]